MLGKRMLMAAAGAAGGGSGFRYLRMDITDVDGGVRIAIGEIEWLVSGTPYPTSNMTSNTAPSPLVASASSVITEAAWNAFDGATTGMQVDGTAGWLTVDLGSGNGITPTDARVTEDTGRGGDKAPKDFTFEGSNTGAFGGEETVFKTVTGETGWSDGEVRTYTF